MGFWSIMFGIYGGGPAAEVDYPLGGLMRAAVVYQDGIKKGEIK